MATQYQVEVKTSNKERLALWLGALRPRVVSWVTDEVADWITGTVNGLGNGLGNWLGNGLSDELGNGFDNNFA